ncbi:MAG: hypothetical protein NTY77_15045 [Elusimicrobia bacterium]|nr:hypothetical protein [Elusimicrobiota bacterium]
MKWNQTLPLLLALAVCGPAQATTDDINLPFQDDPAVVGTWRSVAYVTTPEAFSPKAAPAPNLFLKEQVFLPQGKTPSPSQTWTQGILINSPEKTASRYTFKDINGLKYMFLEWKSGDYTIRNQKPEYYVLLRDTDYAKLPKSQPIAKTPDTTRYADCLVKVPPGGLCKHPAPSTFRPKPLYSLPHYQPDTDKLWQVDLRGQDLTQLDLKSRTDDLLKADFDTATKFPKSLPGGFAPKSIMALGKNPGLGLRSLHRDGITGKGVSMAIIDQALLVDHKEYASRLKTYEEVHWAGPEAVMHAGAVAAFAVGKDIGVAPEAELYYVADWWVDSDGSMNYIPLAKAIDHVIALSAALPKDRRIRVLTIQRGFSADEKGFAEVTAAVERAKQAGIFVVTSSLAQQYGFQFNGLGREPISDPDQLSSYGPGDWWQKRFFAEGWGSSPQTLLVPMDSRTTASPAGASDYVFYREGGWSWSLPYIGGLYALACQVKPDVTPELFWRKALETGDTLTVKKDGKDYQLERIVNPRKLIESLKSS